MVSLDDIGSSGAYECSRMLTNHGSMSAWLQVYDIVDGWSPSYIAWMKQLMLMLSSSLLARGASHSGCVPVSYVRLSFVRLS